MSTGSTPPNRPPTTIIEVRLADATFAAVFKVVAMASFSAFLVWLPVILLWLGLRD